MIVNTKQYKPDKNYVKIAADKSYYGVYPYTTELLNIVNAANSLGYTLPNFSTLRSMDALIRSMKSALIWDKLDIYYQFAYNNGSLANFSLINWKNPSSNATTGGTMVYGTTGYTGNGTTGFINTNFNPTVGTNNFTQNSASRTMVVASNTTTGSLDGTLTGVVNRMNATTTNAHRINANANMAASVNMGGTGLKMAVRTDASNMFFVNNSTQTTGTLASSAPTNASFTILLNTATAFGTATVSNYFIGSALTYTDSQNFRTIYNNYLQKQSLPQIA